jgi:hypothetical protein
MIGLLVAAALSAAPPQCVASAQTGTKLVERLKLRSRDSASRNRAVIVTTHQVSGLGPGDIADMRLSIQSDRCEPLLEQEFEGTQKIRLKLVQISNTPFLVVSEFKLGGSGCGIDHMLISYDGTPRAWAPADLGHDNIGSLFMGDLGRGRGPGLVLLQAQWESGSHYDPHPYRVWTYRWKDDHFVGPEMRTTKPMIPNPSGVAKSLGLPWSEDFGFEC